MKIAVIACSNGLGHIKRDIKIINNFRQYAQSEIDLYCERWQVEKLNNWPEFSTFINTPKTRFIAQTFPLKWTAKSEYYGNWLFNWHNEMKKWDMDQYDLIFSDNYIEPLIYSKRVILGGSFLWHDILAKSYTSNTIILDYQGWALKLLQSCNPKMIVNKYFAMKSIYPQINPCEVGIIHFKSLAFSMRKKPVPGIKNILIALGNAELSKGHIDQVKKFLSHTKHVHYCIHCSEEWEKNLIFKDVPVRRYNFEGSNLDEIDIAIIRGGIGSISDCIAAKVPMIFVDDSNIEVQYNQQCLVNMKIGIPIALANDPQLSPLLNDEQYLKIVKKLSGFDLNGVSEASTILQQIVR